MPLFPNSFERRKTRRFFREVPLGATLRNIYPHVYTHTYVQGVASILCTLQYYTSAFSKCLSKRVVLAFCHLPLLIAIDRILKFLRASGLVYVLSMVRLELKDPTELH